MAKKKKHEDHENLERWLVSYADFMTLLFATFVVLYALSQIDLAKFKDLQISLRKAFSAPHIVQGDKSILTNSGENILSSGADPQAELSIIPPILEAMEAKIEESSFNETKRDLEELSSKNNIDGIDITITDRGLVISLAEHLIFNSGSALILKSAYPHLEKIGKIIKSKYSNHPIRVEGHSDNQPIRSATYPSNWELSSARASSVVRFLIDKFSIEKNRFAAIGYAETKPITSNNSETGRRKNRRVEIVVLRNKLAKYEPKITGLNKARIQDLKNLEKQQQNLANQYKDKYKNISDAAKKLILSTGQSVKDVIIYKDPYLLENEKIEKEIKEKEAKKREQLKLPNVKLEKAVSISREEARQIEQAKKEGIINDAVAELMKERGTTQDALIIRETNKY